MVNSNLGIGMVNLLLLKSHSLLMNDSLKFVYSLNGGMTIVINSGLKFFVRSIKYLMVFVYVNSKILEMLEFSLVHIATKWKVILIVKDTVMNVEHIIVQ
ncbi:hypothetical protein DQT32_03970 [Salmonella enterica subsp. enterica serovar Braenderup]|nr:hypothetical protein [Salmonella enterica subsp. enterica serovar Braenderup]